MTDLLGHPVMTPAAAVAAEYIAFYNRLLERAFKGSKVIEKRVSGLMAQGATLREMELVTEWLAKEWLGTKMEKWLIPDTILRPMRWRSRLDQAIEWERKKVAESQRAIEQRRQLQESLISPPDVVPAAEVRDVAAGILARLKGGG